MSFSEEMPEVSFKKAEQQEDWRASKDEDFPDDDEERPVPEDVIEMLGFDPSKEPVE